MEKSTPPCPWGAPAASPQCGSPLPVKSDSASSSSPQHNPTNRSFQGTPNSFQGRNSNENTLSSHPYRPQRSSPYQSRSSNRMGLTSHVGGSPHFQNRTPNFSPRNYQPRSRFQNSPRFSTPSGSYRPRFNDSPNNSFGSQSDYTPSPNQRNSDKKSFNLRASHHPNSPVDASRYVRRSMLIDPWQDLPPVPMLRSY